MHHGIEFQAVLSVCLILAAGAGMRLLARRARVPYTVGMLLLGLGTGLAIPVVGEHGVLGHVLKLLGEAPQCVPAGSSEPWLCFLRQSQVKRDVV